MLYVLGVVLAFVGIALSIALHEVGHLVPAKKFGVRVPQYMVGFGPTMWSRTRGETEYGVKAVPLGGYIRMIGMFPPAKGQDPTMTRSSSTGRFGQLADEARKQHPWLARFSHGYVIHGHQAARDLVAAAHDEGAQHRQDHEVDDGLHRGGRMRVQRSAAGSAT